MLLRIVRMEFAPEHVEAFHAVFEASRPLIAAFEGCRVVSLLADADHPAVRYTLSVWESPEALEAYRSSPLFADTWARTKVLFGGRPAAFSLVLPPLAVGLGTDPAAWAQWFGANRGLLS
jgi:quinol monooxygenase YgiN